MPGTSPPYFVLTPPNGDTTSNRPTPVSWVVSTISTMINTSWQNIGITGGTINGVPIGTLTPSTAKFTTLTTSSTVSFGTIPTTLTASTGDNTQNLATTAFVSTALGNIITKADTPPTYSNYAPFWMNTTDGQLYLYYGSAWVTVANFSGGNGYLPSTGGVVTGNLSVAGSTTIVAGSIDNTVIGGTTAAAATITSLNGGPLAGFRNRIINGDMRIDQRNEGSLISTFGYAQDRWLVGGGGTSGKLTFQQSSTNVPNGFVNSLLVTSTSAYTPVSGDNYNIQQRIEGCNLYDLAWNTSSAKSLTLSFWVYSTITGNYSFELYSNQTRYYLTTYNIPTANVWTYVTISIPPDTSSLVCSPGQFALIVVWSLGGYTTTTATSAWSSGNIGNATGAVSLVKTSGAVFGITGVQLEVGTVATPFEVRPYGIELMLCQRYYEKSYLSGGIPGSTSNGASGAAWAYATYAASAAYALGHDNSFKVTKMAQPTMTYYSYVTGASGKIRDATNNVDINATSQTYSTTGFAWLGQNATAATSAQFYAHWTASSEL